MYLYFLVHYPIIVMQTEYNILNVRYINMSRHCT